jgi:hypothetical protein
LSEKKKLGRGLADVMDVFFPSQADASFEEKKETKPLSSMVQIEEKDYKKRLFLKENTYPVAENSYLIERDVSDKLSLKLNPYEDVIYNKLYRLSLGEGRNYCQIGYGGIIEVTGLKCTRTVKIAIENLIEKKYIARINIDDKDRKGKGTLYRIFMASEIISGKTAEGFELSSIDGKGIDGIRE